MSRALVLHLLPALRYTCQIALLACLLQSLHNAVIDGMFPVDSSLKTSSSCKRIITKQNQTLCPICRRIFCLLVDEELPVDEELVLIVAKAKESDQHVDVLTIINNFRYHLLNSLL
jgi:hypothetical protein